MPLKPRSRNIYDPASKEAFKLSRSKLEDFIRCPRCFYLDRRLGIGRPSMPAFTLNVAVDRLLKKEFDLYRAIKEPHPLMKEKGIQAIPFQHPELDNWRENFKGLQFYHKPTNFIITGAIDDLWVTKKDELIVVDYKATSTEEEINLDDEWKQSYKNQMEIYQWILKGMGFSVFQTGYFVYVNGRKDLQRFDETLHFHTNLIEYKGNSGWVEETVRNAHKCLKADAVPGLSEDCEYCFYQKSIIGIKTSNKFQSH